PGVPAGWRFQLRSRRHRPVVPNAVAFRDGRRRDRTVDADCQPARAAPALQPTSRSEDRGCSCHPVPMQIVAGILWQIDGDQGDTRVGAATHMVNPKARPCDEAMIRSTRGAADCARRQKRWVLAASVLASTMAFVDESVVNVALPRMQTDL